MSTTIFIWMPRTSVNSEQRSVGHASLHLGGRKKYISFWPENGSSGKAVNHNMGADRKFESGRLPDYASAPIECLDEIAMEEYWSKIKTGTRRAPFEGGQAITATDVSADAYEIFGNNCSRVAMSCLIAGGALKNNRVKTIYDPSSTTTPIDIRQIAEILSGEAGTVGGAKFPIAESLIDKALNFSSNALAYTSYIAGSLVGKLEQHQRY